MRKLISISLDRERFLKLDLNAMAEFEDITGLSLFTIGQQLANAKNVRAVLYVAMKAAKEEITLEEVGELINADNFEMAVETIGKLMTKSYGETENQDDKKK